mgnify:CR=1 FL=1
MLFQILIVASGIYLLFLAFVINTHGELIATLLWRVLPFLLGCASTYYGLLLLGVI